MDSLSKLLRRYAFKHWPAIAAAMGGGLFITLLNLVSLALFAAIPYFILERFGGPGLIGPTAPAPSAPKISLNIENIVASVGTMVDQQVADRGMIATLLILAAAYLGVVILTRCVQFGTEYVILLARNHMARQVSKDVFEHVSDLSLEFFHRGRVGDLQQRIMGNSFSLANSTFEIVNVLVTALPLFVFYWTVLLITDWRLTLAVTGVLGVKLATGNYLARKIRGAIIQTDAEGGNVAARLIEVLANIAVVKAFATEKFECSRYNAVLDEQQDVSLRRSYYDLSNAALQTILHSMSMVMVAVVGVLMLIEGLIEPATLVVYFYAANRSQEPTRKFVVAVTAFNSARGASVRVFELTRERPAVDDGPRQTANFRSDIQFRATAFQYAPDKPALKGIDFTLRKGEVLAVTGPSGAGKSTLIGLLLRFHDPDSGSVLVDGVDVREYSRPAYRRLFGVVTQDPILFNATIRENIAYSLPDREVSDDEVVRAARLAHVEEFVAPLKEGYETLIGDRGVRLSGGQKQRIALARAILLDPAILVLDEPTSSLDSHSERLIQNAVDRYLKDRTAIIVAHRLSTIRNADRILVLDSGHIIEEGKHKELMEKRGLYSSLFEAQSSQFETVRGDEPVGQGVHV